LLTRQEIMKLKELDLDILEFSLYGSNSKIHGVLGDAGKFKDIVDNMKYAADIGLTTGLFSIVNKSNLKDIRNLIKLASYMGVKRFGVDFSKPDKSEVLSEELRALLQFNFWARRFIEIKMKLLKMFSPMIIRSLIICSGGTTNCHIDSYGNISPCVILLPSKCNDMFGNVLHEDLKHIWEGVNFKRFINTRCYGAPCSLCPVPYFPIFRSFPRCRADCRRNVYLKTKDMFAGNRKCFAGRIILGIVNLFEIKR
jgi:radical SAM protein with 4Fe4S-binding SPASM domain